jgi:hypothetical protein
MTIPVKTGQNISMPPQPVSVAPGTGCGLRPGIFSTKVINFIEHGRKKDYHMLVLENLLRVLVFKKGGSSG